GTLDTKPSIELVVVAIARGSTARSAKQKSGRGNGGSFTRPNSSTRECRNIEVTLVRPLEISRTNFTKWGQKVSLQSCSMALKVLRPVRKICTKECNPNLNMNRSEGSFNELVAEDTALRRVSIVTDSLSLGSWTSTEF
ncbi:hypothetical protein ALC62_09510, partial [Cyphomyrmex costatus]